VKVAYFVHQFFPQFIYGTENYTLSVAKSMQEAGVEVVVVTTIPETAEKSDNFYHEYEYEGVPVICFDKNWLPHEGFREAYYQPSMQGPLQMLLEIIRPDIIHVTHLQNHSAIVLTVAERMNIPTVATLTDFFAVCPKGILQGADGRMCTGPNAKRSNCVTCVLNIQANKPQVSAMIRLLAAGGGAVSLGAELLTQMSRLNIIPSKLGGGIKSIREIRARIDDFHRLYMEYAATIAPTRYLESIYEQNEFSLPMHLQHFGVDVDRAEKPVRSKDETLRFGYIGQITHHKGVDLLIDAFCSVSKGCELHVYGTNEHDPGFVEALKNKAEEGACPVFFHGMFPPVEMAEKLRPIDVLVIPSRWQENSPLVLLNALATHTPVIISDAEGMTEFVTEGENGFIFPMGDGDYLHKIITKLADDKHHVLGMSKTTDYERTTANMCEDILHLYNELVL